MRNAYVIRVNIHQAGWNGTVCSTPTAFVDCKGSPDFKSDFCERGIAKCFFMNLFAPDPTLRLTRSQSAYVQMFEAQPPEQGDLAILWGTYADRRNVPIGVWGIEDFRVDDRDYVLYGDSSRSIRFPERSVDMQIVNMRQMRSMGAEMMRFLEPDAIRPVLDQFHADLVTELDRRTQLGLPEDEAAGALTKLRSITENLPERDSGLTQRLNIPSEIFKIFDKSSTTTDDESAIAAGDDEAETTLESTVPTIPASAAPTAAVAPENDISLDDFPAELRRDYTIALDVSSLVLLAGPSGVGKTQLARAYATSVGARFELVPVRPDWRSNEDLLGYRPPFGGEFVYTTFSNFVHEAAQEYQKAIDEDREPQSFHVCLDEMNLARPEYYMAEVLSRMELTGDLRSLQLYEAPEDEGFPRRVALTPNLRIIGTVNNDDTTQPLSPKVLDRAVYLKCETIDLRTFFGPRGDQSLVNALVELDALVRDTGLRIAYRVAGQIEAWMTSGLAHGMEAHEALDAAIDALVLSKLRLQRSDPNHVDALDRIRVFLAERLSTDEMTFSRSIATLDRLRSSLERSDFAIGQFET